MPSTRGWPQAWSRSLPSPARLLHPCHHRGCRVAVSLTPSPQGPCCPLQRSACPLPAPSRANCVLVSVPAWAVLPRSSARRLPPAAPPWC